MSNNSYDMPIISKKIVRVIANLLIRIGIYPKKHSPDRRVLEEKIFPYFIRDINYHSILFVGCDWFTKKYNRFFNQKDYWTLDCDPKRRLYGSKNHIAGNIANLATLFPGNYFDLIICNGVYGWGLNEHKIVEAAFNACHYALRDKGILVIGWNNIPQRNPHPLDCIGILKKFKHYIFPPLNTSIFETVSENKHTYNFYLKSEPENEVFKRGEAYHLQA